MSRPRSNRTEPMSIKVSVPDMKRLDSAVDRLGLASRNEAMNRALAYWLNHVEWNAVRDQEDK